MLLLMPSRVISRTFLTKDEFIDLYMLYKRQLAHNPLNYLRGASKAYLAPHTILDQNQSENLPPPKIAGVSKIRHYAQGLLNCSFDR